MKRKKAPKPAFIRTLMEPKLKTKVEAVPRKWDITPPFEFAKFNRVTKKAIEEARRGKGIVKCKDENDFFCSLGF